MCSTYRVIETCVRNATKRLYLRLTSLSHFRFPARYPFSDDNGIAFLVERQIEKTHIIVKGSTLKYIIKAPVPRTVLHIYVSIMRS